MPRCSHAQKPGSVHHTRSLLLLRSLTCRCAQVSTRISRLLFRTICCRRRTWTRPLTERRSTSWCIGAGNVAGQLFAPTGQKCSQKQMWKVRHSRLAVRRIAAALKPFSADKRTILLNSLGGARSKKRCNCQYGSSSLTGDLSNRFPIARTDSTIPSRCICRTGNVLSQRDVSFPRVYDKPDSFSATYSDLASHLRNRLATTEG